MRNIVFSRDLTAAIALALLVGADLAGCSQNNPQPPASTSTTTVNTAPPPQSAPSPAATSTANAPGTNNVNAGPGGAVGTNSAVADAVNKAIHTNVQLTGSRITAVVDSSGVATLTGTAQDQQQKALAVRAATNTAGVTSVKDKIEIAPTGGAKAHQVATKVIHETKVIVVPSGSNSSQSGNAGAYSAAGTSPPSGSANAAGSGNGTGTGSTSGTTNSGAGAQSSAGTGANAQRPGGNGQ